MTMFDIVPNRPQGGDVVRLDTDDWWGADKGDLAVIDSGKWYGDGFLMLVFRASAFRKDDYVSCSGGPCPSVKPDELTFVGTTEREFWNWGGNIPGAGKGVPFKQTVNLWSWTPRKEA